MYEIQTRDDELPHFSTLSGNRLYIASQPSCSFRQAKVELAVALGCHPACLLILDGDTVVEDSRAMGQCAGHGLKVLISYGVPEGTPNEITELPIGTVVELIPWNNFCGAGDINNTREGRELNLSRQVVDDTRSWREIFYPDEEDDDGTFMVVGSMYVAAEDEPDHFYEHVGIRRADGREYCVYSYGLKRVDRSASS